MFDAIAPQYDLLNHVLSAGLDADGASGRLTSCHLSAAQGARSLHRNGDLAVATRAPPGGAVVGMDFSAAMLRLGLAKCGDSA